MKARIRYSLLSISEVLLSAGMQCQFAPGIGACLLRAQGHAFHQALVNFVFFTYHVKHLADTVYELK